MRAGELRHRVTIQYPTVTRDASGAEVVTWNTAATVWGRLRPLTTRWREHWAAQAQEATVSYEFSTWWRQGITSKHRLLFGNRTFDIVVPINVDEANVELVLLLEESV